MPCVRFGSRAKALLQDLNKRNLDLMSRQRLVHCRDFLAKLTGHIARMAAKNHVFLGAEGDVSVEMMELAEQVCWYHFQTYQWMHNPSDKEPQRVRDAVALETWLRERSICRLPCKHVTQLAMVMGMTTTRLRSAIAELAIQGRVRMPSVRGQHNIEILPPVDQLDDVLSYGGV